MQQEKRSIDSDLKSSSKQNIISRPSFFTWRFLSYAYVLGSVKIVLLEVTAEISNPSKRYRSSEIQVTKFYDEDECETHIHHHKDDGIILVINSSWTLEMLNKFHRLQAVKKIYVHSNIGGSSEKEKMDFPRVISVFFSQSWSFQNDIKSYRFDV